MTDVLPGAPSAPTPLSAHRRTVLAASAAGVAVSATTLLSEPAEARGLPARERFHGLVGRTFTATHDGHTTRWRLEAVHDSPFRPRGLRHARLAAWRRADFVLEWSTRSHPAQATYTMHHAGTGSFRMFAVPGTSRRNARTSVTAVFSRWRG